MTRCNFCGGVLGAVQKQPHTNPDYAQYKTCLNCGHQWAKKYWSWLEALEAEAVKK